MNEDIAFYAFRYALGRRTYSVGIVVSYLLDNWDLLSAKTKETIKSEITEAINNNNAGMEMDVKEWSKLLTP